MVLRSPARTSMREAAAPDGRDHHQDGHRQWLPGHPNRIREAAGEILTASACTTAKTGGHNPITGGRPCTREPGGGGGVRQDTNRTMNTTARPTNKRGGRRAVAACGGTEKECLNCTRPFCVLDQTNGHCLVCGVGIAPRSHGSPRKFCSDSCSRFAHYSRQHDESIHLEPLNCVVCGAVISGRRSRRNTQYCSRKCILKVYRQRKREKELKKRINRHCRLCGAELPATKPTHTLYCSTLCMRRADKLRRKESCGRATSLL